MTTDQETIDVIKFKHRDGCYNTIRELLFNQGYSLVPKGGGIYESVPDERRQHEIRVNIHEHTISLHCKNSHGRCNDDDAISGVKKLLEGKLEVIED